MPVKLKYRNSTSTNTKFAKLLHSRIFRIALIAFLGVLVVGTLVFGYFYYHYQRVVDDRIAAGPIFASVSQIYAASPQVRDGQKLSANVIAADLRQAGYNSNPKLGTFQLNGDNIFIKPGPESFHNTDGATINTSDGRSLPAWCRLSWPLKIVTSSITAASTTFASPNARSPTSSPITKPAAAPPSPSSWQRTSSSRRKNASSGR